MYPMDDYALSYDEECHMKEQREYQRYYNTPVEVNGVLFACLADYDEYYRMKTMEEGRLAELTEGLMALVKMMAHEEEIRNFIVSVIEFPLLTK